MKILLVQPKRFQKGLSVDDFACFRPLALETIAGNLQNHDVRIFDCRFEDDIHTVLEELSPDIVAITALTATVYSALYILKTAKALLPSVITVAGGQHASLAPEDFCHSFVDFLVIGEGELIFSQLVDLLEKRADQKGTAEMIKDLPGIAIPSNGGLEFSKPFELISDLSACDLPNRSLTKKHDAHYLWIDNKTKMSPVQTSKGCPYRCKFCGESRLNKGKYRLTDPDRIIREIKSLEADFIYIVDNNFFENTKRLEKLCEGLKGSDIKKGFFAMGRAESIAKNPNTIESLRAIGLQGVLVGFEDFRDEKLVELGTAKASTHYRKAIEILDQNGLFVIGSFIINPDFSRDDFAYFEELLLSLEIAHYDIHVLTPFPGTRLYDEAKTELTSRDLRLFDGFHLLVPSRLDREEFYRRYIDLYLNTWKNTSKKKFFQDAANPINYIPIAKAAQNYKTLMSLPDHKSFLSGLECSEEFVPDSVLKQRG